MARIGLLPLTSFSHVQAMVCLALELEKRGHEVVFFGVIDLVNYLKGYPHFRICTYAEQEYPKGSVENIIKEQAKLSGLQGLLNVVRCLTDLVDIKYRRAPEVMKQESLDILIFDEAVATTDGTLAQHLGIPCIGVANAALCLPDSYSPPSSSSRPYSNTWTGRVLTFAENLFLTLISIPIIIKDGKQRAAWGLPKLSMWDARHAILPEMTILAQGVPSFEYPRARPSPQVHFIGRWSNPDGSDPLAKDVSFPYERLDKAKKMVYVSFGTVQTKSLEALSKVIRVAAKLKDVQVVASLGKNDETVPLELKENNCIVVPFAPQFELISRAAVFVTHAGMNSAMMALAHGVPTVCIPITNDQPGVAARIAKAGAGVVVPLPEATENRIRSALQEVLNNPIYKSRATEISAEYIEAGGVIRAGDIVERVIETKQPVVSKT